MVGIDQSVFLYVDESIKACKELAAFIKKRQAVEADHAKAMLRITAAFQKSNKGVVTGLNMGLLQHERSEAVRVMLQKSSVWRIFSEMITDAETIANAQLQKTKCINQDILIPFVAYIKEMETTRKGHIERIQEYTRTVEEVVNCLRKAKRDLDAAQALTTDLSANYSKAQVNASTKERDLEKLSQKVQASVEKTVRAQETVKMYQDLCSQAQSEYFQVLLPKLCEDVLVKEEERSVATSQVMSDFLYVENLHEKAISDSIGVMMSRVSSIEVSADSKEIVDKLVRKEVVHRHQMSAAQHADPIHTGYFLVKRGNTVNEWIPQYCVLTSDKYLDFYDVNQLERPFHSVHLKEASVLEVHPSMFGKKFCLQASQYTLLAGRELINMCFESETERDEWFHFLSMYCYCCNKCAARNGYSAETEMNMNIVDKDNGYRLVQSVEMTLMEAKDILIDNLDIKSLNAFCSIQLGDLKVARTRAKESETPFWGEDFTFDAIRPHFRSLKVVISHQNRLKRHLDLGFVEIRFDSLKPNKRVEEWYQIKGKEDTSVSKGSIRIALKYQLDQVLPRQDYNSLLQLLTEPKFRALNILGSVAPSTLRASFGKLAVRILLSKGLEVDGIGSLIESDIINTNDPNIIFRGNTLATKAMDSFMSLVGMDYLHATIGTHVRAIYHSNESCEVDPLRVENPDALKKNFRRLMEHVTGIWEAIMFSVDNCPSPFFEIFNIIHAGILQRWGEGKSAVVKYSAISGFIFLRFFCPAILSPNLFKIIDDVPDGNRSRTFTLVAKIIQNLANLSEFGQKEQYLAGCNDFIKHQIPNMKRFIDKISARRTPKLPVKDFGARVDLGRETEAFFQLFCQLTKELEILRDQKGTAPSDVYVAERLLSEFKRLNTVHDQCSQTCTGRESMSASRVTRISGGNAASPVRKHSPSVNTATVSSLPVRFGTDFVESPASSRPSEMPRPDGEQEQVSSPTSNHRSPKSADIISGALGYHNNRDIGGSVIEVLGNSNSSASSVARGDEDNLQTAASNPSFIIHSSQAHSVSAVEGGENSGTTSLHGGSRRPSNSIWTSLKGHVSGSNAFLLTSAAEDDPVTAGGTNGRLRGPVRNLLQMFSQRRGSKDVAGNAPEDAEAATDLALKFIEEKGFNSFSAGNFRMSEPDDDWDDNKSGKSEDIGNQSNHSLGTNIQDGRTSSISSVQSTHSVDKVRRKGEDGGLTKLTKRLSMSLMGNLGSASYLGAAKDKKEGEWNDPNAPPVPNVMKKS
ncbi:hypothetical protein BC830DRAFT_1094513 [Chytriomyces sp. MP71]|nr:hypothetical protein BC830DRAFT_1094513 [Chytriomyces sp. MP71]